MKNKTYELHLPTFMSFVDLECAMEETESLEDAFQFQAAQYEMAAGACHRMSQVIADNDDITIDTANETITINGPAERLEELCEQGLICCCEEEDDNLKNEELN